MDRFAARALPTLENLSFSGWDLTNPASAFDTFCQAIAKGIWPELVHLTLEDAGLKDDHIEKLMAGVVSREPNDRFSRVAALSLTGNSSLGKRGAKAIAQALQAKAFVGLENLYLEDTSIGDEGLMDILSAIRARELPPCIKTLALSGSKITFVGVNALLQ